MGLQFLGRVYSYRTVQTHVETWLALRRNACDDTDAIPAYVERDFRRYLECGILAHGLSGLRVTGSGSPISHPRQ